ncbi:uncharacterized protein ISCGN_027169 [Ixodes scapularis]
MARLPGRLQQVSNLHFTIYADTVSPWTVRGDVPQQQRILQRGIDVVTSHLQSVGLTASPDKTTYVVIAPRRERDANISSTLHLTLAGQPIRSAPEVRILGLQFHEDGTAKAWLTMVAQQCQAALNVIGRISGTRGGADKEVARRMVKTLIVSRICYGARHYRLTNTQWKKLEILTNNAARIVTGLPRYTPLDKLKAHAKLNTARETVEAARVNLEWKQDLSLLGASGTVTDRALAAVMRHAPGVVAGTIPLMAAKLKANVPIAVATILPTLDHRGSFAEAVSSRGPAPSKVLVATQVSLGNPGKPLQSSTPGLKLSLPGHSLFAAKAAEAPSCSKDSGAAEAMEVTALPTPSRSSSEERERASRLFSQKITSSPKKPSASGGSTPADSQCQNMLAMPVRGSRTSSGEERHSRQNSLERSSSSKGQHLAAPSGSQGKDQRDLGNITPSISPASSVGGGRRRGYPPRAADLPKPPGKVSSEKVEAMNEATDPPTPASDHEGIEWQTPNRLGGKHQPIKARSLLFAAHGKCFQGLGGKNQPIKARSLFFAAHGKCFQVSMAHKPAGASSFSFKACRPPEAKVNVATSFDITYQRKHEEGALDPCQKDQLGPLMAPLIPGTGWHPPWRVQHP